MLNVNRWQLSGVLAAVALLALIVAPSAMNAQHERGTVQAPCALNAQEQRIADLMGAHPDQQRQEIVCDPILLQVARERARDMGERNYFSHTNPDGFGPNYLVEQAGYDLPPSYTSSPTDNFIESIAAGHADSDTTWDGWMNSDGHRTHLTASNPFYATQTRYGIGYAFVPGSKYQSYWVVLTAPPSEGSPPTATATSTPTPTATGKPGNPTPTPPATATSTPTPPATLAINYATGRAGSTFHITGTGRQAGIPYQIAVNGVNIGIITAGTDGTISLLLTTSTTAADGRYEVILLPTNATIQATTPTIAYTLDSAAPMHEAPSAMTAPAIEVPQTVLPSNVTRVYLPAVLNR